VYHVRIPSYVGQDVIIKYTVTAKVGARSIMFSSLSANNFYASVLVLVQST